jgi:DNA-directed RNA polymerase subunit beta'
MGGVQQESDITQGLTRVDEILEAKNPKSPAILTSIDGEVKVETKGRNTEIHVDSKNPVKIEYTLEENFLPVVNKGDEVSEKQIIAKSSLNNNVLRSSEIGKVVEVNNFQVIIETLDPVQKIYLVPKGKNINVANGQKVQKGQALTSGSINLKELIKLTDEYTTLKYIIEEVQNIYALQGQNINDKHIEMIARQMVSRVKIIDSGESELTPGAISNKIKVDNINKVLEKDGKKTISYERMLMGLIPIALSTDSWLSAASFQETIKVLVDAATTKRIDNLNGLKENVIIGKLIPAGETYRKNHQINE